MAHPDWLLSLIEHYGYLVVFFGVALESAGVPVPGETVLLAAGVLAQRGHLDVAGVAAVGILGAVLGDQVGYWAGRRGGRPYVLRWGGRVGITPGRLARAEDFFARHGGKAVFLARFFAGFRVLGALVAGISHMRWGTFAFYNALGGMVWASAAVLAGYLLGGSLGLVERWLGRATLLVGVLAALALVLYVGYRWVSNHPEPLRRAFERLDGGRMRRFLGSPVGLWLRRRFSPGGAFGLTLTVGLAFTGLFSWVLGGIVEDLVNRDPLVRVDARVLAFVHAHREPTLTGFVAAFERVFSPGVLLVAAAAAGLILALAAHRRGDLSRGFPGFVLLAMAAGAGTLSALFGLLFDRPHPPVPGALAGAAGGGFPSVHAMAAVSIGAAVWYSWSLRPAASPGGSWAAKVRVGIGAAALALLVGLGELYVGTQYPSGVLAGWAVGGLWASVCLTAAEVYRRLREGDEKVPETGVRYAQFSLVGATNALVDLGTLNLILLLFPTRSPTTLVLYNLLALAITNVNSYLWNTLWTFRHRARHDARQIGLFVAQAAVSIAVGSLVLWLVARGLVVYEGLPPLLAGNVAKVASMVAGSTTSFVILRFFVFGGKGGPD